MGLVLRSVKPAIAGEHVCLPGDKGQVATEDAETCSAQAAQLPRTNPAPPSAPVICRAAPPHSCSCRNLAAPSDLSFFLAFDRRPPPSSLPLSLPSLPRAADAATATAMKGPGLFSDIGKKAKDLLTKDYTYDQKLTISTVSASGVGLTSTAVKKGGLYSLDVSSVYKYKNTLVNVKVDTESNISTTLTVLDALPSTKLVTSVKLPDYNSGKVELHYFHENASFATVVGTKPSPVVELSGTVGAQGVMFGAEAGYDTATGKFTKYTAAIGVTKPDYHAAFILADKGDTIKVSGVYHLDEKQKASAVAELTRRLSTNENTLTVGGLYTVDPQTAVKARLNNTGTLGALLQHELKPKSLLTISGEFDTKALDRPPKFGLALALKP